jgi:hypothetical protein
MKRTAIFKQETIKNINELSRNYSPNRPDSVFFYYSENVEIITNIETNLLLTHSEVKTIIKFCRDYLKIWPKRKIKKQNKEIKKSGEKERKENFKELNSLKKKLKPEPGFIYFLEYDKTFVNYGEIV